jgi:hypothetical protein
MQNSNAQQLRDAHQWAMEYIKAHDLKLTYRDVYAQLQDIDLSPTEATGSQLPPISYAVCVAIGWPEAYTYASNGGWWDKTFLPILPKYLAQFRDYADKHPTLIACERGMYPDRYRTYAAALKIVSPFPDKHVTVGITRLKQR